MGVIKSIFSKGLAQGFSLFSLSKRHRRRRNKTRRNKRRHTRRHFMRGG